MVITIFIRARNEAALISLCLERVFSQPTPHELDVIVLDSGSTDSTVALVRDFPVRLYTIPAEKFSYSGALNLGVSLARGELFVSLSAHAIPRDDGWLSALIVPLESNANVDGAFSRQVPWPDVSRIEFESIARAFGSESGLLEPENLTRRIQAGEEPFEVAKFSNVSACMRTALLRETPFDDVPFAEDRAWALRRLLAGGCIAYAAESIVYHSHPPSLPAFRAVAERATIARAAINALSLSTLGVQQPKKKPSATLLVLPFMVAGTILYAFAVGLLSLRHGGQAASRNFLFLLCSVGTTLGKSSGAQHIRRFGFHSLAPAPAHTIGPSAIPIP